MRWLTLAVLVMAAVSGCSGGEPTPPPEPKEQPKPKPEIEAPPAPKEIQKMVPPEGHHPALLDPSKASEQAPAKFRAKFETTKGNFVVEVHRDWAPSGADRFYNLVKIGFYDNCKFFRAIDGFMVQFGISPYPDVSAVWREATLQDEEVKEGNKRGRITYAMGGKNSRTTQLFINFQDNSNLDSMGFASFGEVVEGMEIVDSLFKGYGEGAPRGRGPDQGRVQMMGNAYLEDKFPKLDGIVKVTIE